MNNRETIKFFFEDIKKISFNENKYREWIIKIIKSERSIPGFLNIIFVSNQYLLQLNKKHLKHYYYTDVITFEYTADESDGLCGEIYISIDTVKENAKRFKQTIEKETLRVIAHGVLHLLDYDDKTSEEKDVMRKKEDIYLEQFS